MFLTDLFQNSGPSRIVFGELDFDPVSRQQPDPIPLRATIPLRYPGAMRQDLRLIRQLQSIHQAG